MGINWTILKRKFKIILLLGLVSLCRSDLAAQSAGIVNVGDFGAIPNGEDVTYPVRLALAQCKKTKAKKLIFPKGRYEFYPDKATEKYFYISNNDEGLKRVAFPVFNFDGLEIDGQGSEFIFHGYTCPFIIENSKNISIRNISIDYVRTFHSEGKIMAVGDWGFDVAFSPEFGYKIESGLLKFVGDNNSYGYSNLLEFDAVKKETAFMAKDYWLRNPLAAEELPGGIVRILKKDVKATVGNVMVFGASERLVPGFTISDSKNVLIHSINIYHCGGMGVIGQRSSDITLDAIQVTPSPGKNRIVSITADATHFVNCTGRIVIQNCLFENQKDDATNIHGIYAAITKIISSTEIEVRLKHRQQFGSDFIGVGKKIELVQSSSLVTLAEIRVKDYKRLNKEISIITLDKPIPSTLKLNDVVGSAEEKTEVWINNCMIRSNRARGLLIGSRGKTIIENNFFHVPGAAILFEGDGRFWYEQSGVRDCIIRNNIFENCNFGVWGNAVIQVASGINKEEREKSRYNTNILIENNVFRIFDPRILNLYSVANVMFRKNKIEQTTAYPNIHAGEERFIIEQSDSVKIEE